MFPGGYCAGLGVLGWLLMIGFWGALLAVVVWAVTRLFPSTPGGAAAPPESPAEAPAESPPEPPVSTPVPAATVIPTAVGGRPGDG